MELVQDKDKRTGLIGTAIFHGVLLLLFMFFGLNYMVPPPEEEGITINFGTSNDGMGDQQPVEPVVNQEQQQQQETSEPVTTPVQTETNDEVITQDMEEAPKIKNEKTTQDIVQEKKPEEVKPQPSKQLTDALNKMKNASNSKQSSEGETGKPGDQGKIDGDPNSKNRVGGGSGNGISFNLAGRKMTGKPVINDDSQEQGKVVINIVVDRNGNVVRATTGGRGSTTTSPILLKKAKEAALRTKFSAKSTGAIEQKGTMTFIFILN